MLVRMPFETFKRGDRVWMNRDQRTASLLVSGYLVEITLAEESAPMPVVKVRRRGKA